MDNTKKVVAHKITKRKIYYKCPTCFTNKSGERIFKTRYFKNGGETNRQPTLHCYENKTNSLENFECTVLSQCTYWNGDVKLLITDDTLKEETNFLMVW
tara:strand:- start:4596 stop:4892 length:297 start_codon:yes stop_codon:yes gene_type:complete